MVVVSATALRMQNRERAWDAARDVRDIYRRAAAAINFEEWGEVLARLDELDRAVGRLRELTSSFVSPLAPEPAVPEPEPAPKKKPEPGGPDEEELEEEFHHL